MVCLIKQDGAEIISWFIAPTLESVALHSDDHVLMKELLGEPERYSAYGNYRLLGGKYTLLVGSIGTPNPVPGGERH
jgi:hypothetical protein